MENFIDLIPFTFAWPLVFLALPLPWLIKQKASNTEASISAPKLPLFSTFKSLGIQTGSFQEKNPTDFI